MGEDLHSDLHLFLTDAISVFYCYFYVYLNYILYCHRFRHLQRGQIMLLSICRPASFTLCSKPRKEVPTTAFCTQELLFCETNCCVGVSLKITFVTSSNKGLNIIHLPYPHNLFFLPFPLELILCTFHH